MDFNLYDRNHWSYFVFDKRTKAADKEEIALFTIPTLKTRPIMVANV
jgi:hypothetical protein